MKAPCATVGPWRLLPCNGRAWQAVWPPGMKALHGPGGAAGDLTDKESELARDLPRQLLDLKLT